MNVRTERAKENREAGSQKGGMTLSDLLSRGASGDDVYAVSNVRASAHPAPRSRQRGGGAHRREAAPCLPTLGRWRTRWRQT